MIVLISGPNGSGKSALAEHLISTASSKLVYIATMISRNSDNIERIEKHRIRREPMNFHTIEEPYNLSKAVPFINKCDSVLLEDLSNLLANVIFEKNGSEEDILQQIKFLEAHSRRLYIVTISGLDGSEYTGETSSYIKMLNSLNQKVSECASVHIELCNGKPHYTKGEPSDVI